MHEIDGRELEDEALAGARPDLGRAEGEFAGDDRDPAGARGCSGLLREREALRASLRALPRQPAPERLHAAVRARLSAEAAKPATAGAGRRPSSWQAAALAAGCASLSFAVGLWVAGPSIADGEAEQAVSRHLASIDGRHPLVEVVSGDRDTVKPWFTGKVDFAPPVRDLSAEGFTLVGGRMDTLDGRTAAVIVYRLRQHDINLFVTRSVDRHDAAVHPSTLRGFAIARWAGDGLSFTAVSDAEPKELLRFAALAAGTGP